MNKHLKENETLAHHLPTTPMDSELMAARNEKIQVAMIGLCGCWGCNLSFLDMDENLLKLMEKVNINRSSFTDIKEIPVRSAIGFIEGGIANEENIETLIHFRENCDILISVGACAVWGGVPAMRNVEKLDDVLREVYLEAPTRPEQEPPVIPHHEELPNLTNKVYPLHEVVKIDYFIPGCPPDGQTIYKVLDDLVHGRPFSIPAEINRYD